MDSKHHPAGKERTTAAVFHWETEEVCSHRRSSATSTATDSLLSLQAIYHHGVHQRLTASLKTPPTPNIDCSNF